MKKVICILMLAVPCIIFAQESALGISGGYTTNGIGIQASYNYGLSENDYIQAGIYFSIAEDKQETVEVPYNDLTLNIGYFYNIFKSPDNRFVFSLGAGGVLGYEIINSGDNQTDTGALIDGDSQFIYGAFAGAEADFSISDVVSLCAILNQYYHINSDLGGGVFYGGLGIKYHIF